MKVVIVFLIEMTIVEELGDQLPLVSIAEVETFCLNLD
jgi:hypothetical protein